MDEAMEYLSTEPDTSIALREYDMPVNQLQRLCATISRGVADVAPELRLALGLPTDKYLCIELSKQTDLTILQSLLIEYILSCSAQISSDARLSILQAILDFLLAQLIGRIHFPASSD